MNAPGPVGVLVSAKPPATAGVTGFAAILILSPLLQWLYLSALSHFTLLEPPFTRSSGLVLAMQLFFSPGSVLTVVLGVGLLRRSERMRRITRVVSLISLGLAALQIGSQFAAGQFNSNVLLAATTLITAAAYFWYFGRPNVVQQFQAERRPAGPPQPATPAAGVAPGQPRHSRALIASACVEVLFGLAAAALTARLWTVFSEEDLLESAMLSAMPPEHDLLKRFVFVTIALLLSPHLMTAIASIGILLRRATASMARRYSIVACWSVVGCLLLTAWLSSRPGLSFAEHNAHLLFAFCGVSLVWHLCFLYVLARSARAPEAAEPAGKTTQ